MSVRAFLDGDAPAVAALLSAEEECRLVASATFGTYGGTANIRGVVADQGCGFGTEILERGEAFAAAEGAKKILTGAPEPNTAARALFESRGYREVRRFYKMAIELTDAPPAPAVSLYERVGMVVETCGVAFEKAVA